VKRYLLFGGGDKYKNLGGTLDFVKSFDTIEEALGYGGYDEERDGSYDWKHIAENIDGELKVVYYSISGCHWRRVD